jgi:hypothetical protein
MAMPCCGQRNTSRYIGNVTSALPPSAGPPIAAPQGQRRLLFEYAGSTALTVIGPVTGKRYRFAGPGARVEVDRHDRRSLAALSQLRQVLTG